MIRTSSANGNHSAVVEHYARLARTYDRRWDRYTKRTLSTLINRIELPNGADETRTAEHGRDVRSVLDVACGTGRLAEMLFDLDPDIHVTGVDLSPEMIGIAKQRIPEDADHNVKWIVAPAEALPVDDEAFDVVTCANAFHLVADPLRTLAEFQRVLEPGGRLVVIDWCREYPTIAGLLLFSRIFGRQYRRIENVRGLSQTLKAADFSIVHAEKFKATWFWGMMCIVAAKPD